ncbi:MAG: hypothetical protein H6722_12230 [Sandaracinus sp.]|nr:hypothetical protein [Sandaracinus sp.]MCB9613213.1 hypothetical protein [Sandaracinus sp.]
MRAWATGVLTIGLVFSTGRVLAQEAARPVRVSLAWESTVADCPSRAELRREVERRLGRTVFVDDTPDASIAGHVESLADGGSIASIEVRAHGEVLGRRELRSADRDCRVLADALYLVVALLVDVTEREVHLSLPPRPAAAQPPARPRRSPVRPSVEPRPPIAELASPWTVRWTSGAEVAIGALSSVALAGRVTLRLGWRVLSFRLDGTGWRRDEVEVRPPEAPRVAGARLGLFSLGGGVCGAKPRGAHEVGACVGAAFGRLRVEGFGFDTNETTRLVAAELRLDATSRIHLRGPLALRVELGLSVGLGEVTVRFDDVGRTRTLFDRWPVWPHLVLGLELGSR